MYRYWNVVNKKEDKAKVQVNKNICYFELSSKPNIGKLGFKISM